MHRVLSDLTAHFCVRFARHAAMHAVVDTRIDDSRNVRAYCR
jgi:hypothetical protein